MGVCSFLMGVTAQKQLNITDQQIVSFRFSFCSEFALKYGWLSDLLSNLLLHCCNFETPV